VPERKVRAVAEVRAADMRVGRGSQLLGLALRVIGGQFFSPRIKDLRRRWKKLSPEARSEIVSLMLKQGWARLSKSERAERQSKLFWSWFPQADPDTQRRVMTVINRQRRPERRGSSENFRVTP
jgi:hypothetical protein